MSRPTRKRSPGRMESRTILRNDADSPGDMLPRLDPKKAIRFWGPPMSRTRSRPLS